MRFVLISDIMLFRISFLVGLVVTGICDAGPLLIQRKAGTDEGCCDEASCSYSKWWLIHRFLHEKPL